MPKHSFATVVICIALGCLIGSAQRRGFSGSWDSQTNPGVVWTVDQKDNGVRVSTLLPSKQVRDTEWLFDGPPINVIISGFPAQTTAKLDGEFLTFLGPIVLKDASVPARVEQVWKLSQDGNQLTVSTKIVTAATDFSRDQVFRRHQ